MPTFDFEAMGPSGSEVKDRIDAANEAEAQRQLRARGYFVTRLKAFSSESAPNESRMAVSKASDSMEDELADQVIATQPSDVLKNLNDSAQLLSEAYGWIVEPTASGGVRLRISAGLRWFMIGVMFVVLLLCCGFLSWMYFVIGKLAGPPDDGFFRIVFALFYLAPVGIAGLGAVASVLQILWLLLVREEWEAAKNSLEVRRRLSGFSWGRQYENGELFVEANYDRLAKSDAWRLAVKSDSQKHYLISERRISNSGGLDSKRQEVEAMAELLAQYTDWPVRSAQYEASEAARSSTQRDELPAELLKRGFRADVDEGLRLIIRQPLRGQLISGMVLIVLGGCWTTFLAGGLESLLLDKGTVEHPIANLPWVLMMVLMLMPGVVGVLLGFAFLFSRTRWIVDRNLLVVMTRLFWWKYEKPYVDGTLNLARVGEMPFNRMDSTRGMRWRWQLQLLSKSGTALQRLRQDTDDDVPRLLGAVLSEATGWPLRETEDVLQPRT